MVVSFSIKSGSPALADYYTQDQTVEPHLRQDAFSGTYMSMGLRHVLAQSRSFRDISYSETENLICGLRADGLPTGRRIVNDYAREDGKFFKHRDVIDITFSTDISFGMAMANSATVENAQLILNIVQDSADKAMQEFDEKYSISKTFKSHVATYEQGSALWMRFTHHTTRPTREGFIAPDLHIHYVIPNANVLSDGRVRAIRAKNLMDNQKEINAAFDSNMVAMCNQAGIALRKHPTLGTAIVDAVPENVRQEFSRRSRDIQAMARKYAQSKGEDFDSLSRHHKRRYTQRAAVYTQGSKRDGAPQLGPWRERMAALGWPAQDVAAPCYADPGQSRSHGPAYAPIPVPRLTLIQRAHALRQNARHTLAMVRCSLAQAAQSPISLPAFRVPLPEKFALSRSLIQRAETLKRNAMALQAIVKNSLSGIRQRLQITAVMVHSPELITGLGKMADTLATRKMPDAVERLVRVYARKVSAAEMPLSQAVDAFILAEERAVKPEGYNPVHRTHQYPPKSASPANRIQREIYWQDRIMDMVEKVEAGTAWNDVFPAKMNLAPNNTPTSTPKLRMQR